MGPKVTVVAVIAEKHIQDNETEDLYGKLGGFWWYSYYIEALVQAAPASLAVCKARQVKLFGSFNHFERDWFEKGNFQKALTVLKAGATITLPERALEEDVVFLFSYDLDHMEVVMDLPQANITETFCVYRDGEEYPFLWKQRQKEHERYVATHK